MSEKILLVDDDDIFRHRLAKAFDSRGYVVFEAATLQAAREIVSEHKPTKAVVDLCLGDEVGLELLNEYKTIVPDVAFVILTGYGTVATAVSALKAGATNYLTKPVHADEILAAFQEERIDQDSPRDPVPFPTLSQLEWEHIQKVMHDCGGNITHASKRLGLHRRSLQRKLNKLPDPVS